MSKPPIPSRNHAMMMPAIMAIIPIIRVISVLVILLTVLEAGSIIPAIALSTTNNTNRAPNIKVY